MPRLSVRLSALAFLLAFGLGLLIGFALVWLAERTKRPEVKEDEPVKKPADQDLEMNLDDTDQGSKSSGIETSVPQQDESKLNKPAATTTGLERTRNAKGTNEAEPAPDFSQVGSKYLNGLDKMTPVFTNYLTKSNKPFIGYESKSSDEQRAARRASRVAARRSRARRVEPLKSAKIMRSKKYLVAVGNVEVKRL